MRMSRIMACGLVLAAAALSAPALAKTSQVEGGNLCKAEAEKIQPTPKAVLVETTKTVMDNDTVNVFLRVMKADGESGKMACTVDRATDGVKLSWKE